MNKNTIISYATVARSTKQQLQQVPCTNSNNQKQIHFPPGILITPATIAQNLKCIKEARKALKKPVQKLNQVADWMNGLMFKETDQGIVELREGRL